MAPEPPPAPVREVAPPDAESPRVVLRLRGIRKAFGDKVVLDGLDLEVRRSEILVILGRSGGGKSVTLKTLAGLVRPDAGEVMAFKQDVLALDERELRRLRRRFGYVFQSGALLNWMTAEQNVMLPLDESDTGTPGERLARVREVLALVDLPDAGPLFPDQMSGGMRKRVSLARALAQEPSAVLYDEPTTGLDPISTASIDRLITGTRDKTGLTSVVISHDLDSTFRIADRIALLHGGRIRAIADREAFRKLDDPEVRRFLDSQPE
jgi:phospholipid/cholesterol/gamma-HCH transport system ATP-binding protein